jgi:hypothetical protein
MSGRSDPRLPPRDCRDLSPLRVRVALYPLRVLVALYTLRDCRVLSPLRVRVALHPLRDCWVRCPLR